jgi:acyl carrier protein
VLVDEADAADWRNDIKLDDMDDIATRCIAIISKAKNPPLTGVTLDNTFDELGLDSLDKINASFEVEDVFHIQIPDESMNSLRTVRDMVDGVTLLIRQSAGIPAAEESK